MFDLEKALAAWRAFHSRHEAITPADLDEMESHLRDEIDDLVSEGHAPEEAFDRGVQRMGDYALLDTAYTAVHQVKRIHEQGPMHELTWRMDMLRNYVVIALRNLRRNKGYTFINVAGMAVGLSCCLLILMFVQHELSYDRFHANADRIYRVASAFGPWQTLAIPAVTTPRLREQFPEIQNTVRLKRSRVVITQGDEQTFEERFFYADSSVFEVFSFPLLAGDSRTALTEPGTVVLTASTARRYFGEENPIGHTLRIVDGEDLRVTGIAADIPSNSHIHFDFLASYSTLGEVRGWSLQSYTYLLLPNQTVARSLEQKLVAVSDEAKNLEALTERFGWAVEGMRFQFQPLTHIHLHSNLPGEVEPTSDVRYLYLFSIIAAFILLIACINFMNLATARSMQRAREVGVRKVLGARRAQLIKQFLAESLLLSFFSLLIAIVLSGLLLPYYNTLTGKAADFASIFRPQVMGPFLVLTVLVGIAAGSYPALFLSRFNPTLTLKGVHPGRQRAGARKALVAFQLAVSVALISCTLVVRHQLQYMQHKRLGYDTAQVVRMPMRGSIKEQYMTFKQELLAVPGVERASAAMDVPIGGGMTGMYATEKGAEETVPVRWLPVDYDFLETMGIELVAGRDFSELYSSDSSRAILVNETAARIFQLEDKIGQTLEKSFRLTDEEIIGIVRDFHVASLHEEIIPTVIEIDPAWYSSFMVRLNPSNMETTLLEMEVLWKRFVPEYPFTYEFLDDIYLEKYQSEQRLARIFSAFAVLAILIACLGLFGLSAHAAEQRTKEIGIRKVLGATASGIVALLSKDVLWLVLAGAVVAGPLAYLAMSRWLEQFAYRIELGPGVFLLAGGLALAVALLTVSYQALKAATADPVKSLRYE